MLQKILVALDLLDSNEAVFESALSLAIATQGELMLLHALSGDRDGGPALPVSPSWDYYAVLSDRTWSQYQKEWQDYEKRGLNILHRYCQQAADVGITAELTQTIHSPGPLICKLASTWNADVIVVGSHRRRGLSELLIGSVSNYVMHHAPCSVFVVHLNKTPPSAQMSADKTRATPEREVEREVLTSVE
ncbi:MAG: universal stress protein [Phormidesmis sp.]